MAIAKTAAITFQKDDINATTHLPYAASLAAIKVFAAAIQSLSCATIVTCSYTEEELDPGLTGTTGTEGVEVFATFQMRKPNKSGTIQYKLPAPDPNIFEVVGRAYRIKKAYGEAFATAYSTLMGETYTYVNGWMTT